MKKLSLFFLTTLLVLSSALHAETVPLPLKVGAIMPLTGDAASWAEAFRNGMKMALSKLSDEDKKRMEIIYEDDGLNPVRTMGALNKLLKFNGANFFLSMSSGTSKAISPLLEQQKRTLVAIASDREISDNKKYSFTFWVTPEAEAAVMQTALKKRQVKSVSIISTFHPGSLAVRNAFTELTASEIKVVASEEVPFETRTFKDVISKIAANQDRIDGLIVILFPGQTGIFTRQLRELGVNTPLFGFETFEEISDVKASNGAMIGGLYATAATGTPDFLKEYQSQFPGASLFSASNGYDFVMLLNDGIKNSLNQDKVDLEKLNTYLKNVNNFSGATGRFSSTKDNRFSFPSVLRIVEKDGFRDAE